MYKSNTPRTLAWLLLVALLPAGSVGLACSLGSQVPQTPQQNVMGPIGQATFEQLVAHAYAILIGEVTDIAVFNDSSGKPLYNMVTIDVEQVLKGEMLTQAVVRVPAIVDGEARADTPVFTVGERVLLLLDKGTGTFTIEGGMQGRYSIDKNGMLSNNIRLADFIEQVKSILASKQEGK